MSAIVIFKVFAAAASIAGGCLFASWKIGEGKTTKRWTWIVATLLTGIGVAMPFAIRENNINKGKADPAVTQDQ